MKYTMTFQDGMTINYEESFWTGKKTIIVNGISLIKVNKTTYSDGTTSYKLKGNAFSGMDMICNGITYSVVRKLNVLEWILAFLPFFLIILGGAIGGVCGAFAMCTNVLLFRKTNNWLLKIAIALGVCAAATVVYFLLAMIIVMLFPVAG